jgi:hypothetical protein
MGACGGVQVAMKVGEGPAGEEDIEGSASEHAETPQVRQEVLGDDEVPAFW